MANPALRRMTTIAALCLTLPLAGLAQAEKSQDFGAYEVHFNALNTTMLQPEVAKQYGILRSKNRGMLNVVVLRKVLETTGEPVNAAVSATASNLKGQIIDIPMREVTEANAIYYLGQFPIVDQETLRFDIKAKPGGKDDPFLVRFEQKFFID